MPAKMPYRDSHYWIATFPDGSEHSTTSAPQRVFSHCWRCVVRSRILKSELTMLRWCRSLEAAQRHRPPAGMLVVSVEVVEAVDRGFPAHERERLARQ